MEAPAAQGGCIVKEKQGSRSQGVGVTHENAGGATRE